MVFVLLFAAHHTRYDMYSFFVLLYNYMLCCCCIIHHMYSILLTAVHILHCFSGFKFWFYSKSAYPCQTQAMDRACITFAFVFVGQRKPHSLLNAARELLHAVRTTHIEYVYIYICGTHYICMREGHYRYSYKCVYSVPHCSLCIRVLWSSQGFISCAFCS